MQVRPYSLTAGRLFLSDGPQAEERTAREKEKAAEARTLQKKARERLKETATALLQTNQQRRQRERDWGISVDLESDPTPEQLQIELTRLGLPRSLVTELSKTASLGPGTQGGDGESWRDANKTASAALNEELESFAQRLAASSSPSEGGPDTAAAADGDSSDEEEVRQNGNGTRDYSKTFAVLQREREQQGYQRPFSFYSFSEGQSDLPFQDILDTLQKSFKAKPVAEKPLEDDQEESRDAAGRRQLKGTLTQSKTASLALTTTKKSASLSRSQDFKISQFRLPAVEVQWDASFYPDRDLLKKLYRTPCRVSFLLVPITCLWLTLLMNLDVHRIRAGRSSQGCLEMKPKAWPSPGRHRRRIGPCRRPSQACCLTRSEPSSCSIWTTECGSWRRSIDSCRRARRSRGRRGPGRERISTTCALREIELGCPFRSRRR